MKCNLIELKSQLLALKEQIIVKDEQVKIDLGCGGHKPEGYVGLDIKETGATDIVCDLSKGIPFDDNSVDKVRANHFLEHVADKEKIMAEIHRVLKPGGIFEFAIPSTKGEGAFNHPNHKSFWNKTSFKFWTQDNLVSEERPKFEEVKIDEYESGDCVYVKGILKKPGVIKADNLAPFQKYIPPKPAMAGFTEFFTVDELWKWAEDRLGEG